MELIKKEAPESRELSGAYNLQTGQSKGTQFSAFKAPISNKVPERNVTLFEVYQEILGGKYADPIQKIRSSTDLKIKRKLKGTLLDYITPSGTFVSRSAKGLKDYSGILCVDLDHCGTEIKDTIEGDAFLNPSLIFTSPSGDGLKIFICINDAVLFDHKRYYEALKVYFVKTYNIQPDPAPSNIASACFLSHDPDARYSQNGTVNAAALLYLLVPPPKKADSPTPRNYQRPSEKLNPNPIIISMAKRALTKIGWSSKDGVNWVRPGKDPNEEKGAIFNVDSDGIEKFTVFTSNASPFKPNQGYRATNILCLLEFADNWGECIHSLLSEVEPNNNSHPKILAEKPKNTDEGTEYFETRTFDQVILDGKKIPDRKKIIGAFLYEDTNTYLFSRTNYGKSLLAFQLGYAAATGTSLSDYPGLMNQCSPMKVLVADMEMDVKELFDRHNQVIDNTPPELLNNLIYIHEKVNSTQLSGFALLEKIEEIAIRHLVELIIIDNISKILPDLLKAEEVAKVIDFIKRIRTKIGASFLVIGHTTKGDPKTAITPTSYFGSSTLQNFFTEIFFLDTTTDDKFFLCHSKTKRAERYIETVPVFNRGIHPLFGLGFIFDSMQPLGNIQLPLSNMSPVKQRKESLSKFHDQLQMLDKNGVNRSTIAAMCDVNRSTITKILQD
ncbi:MAG: AAA family ATPase [Prolixibacteraceae bacterium]|nr:AAA family ATPase [Prolixibacteraceae bacterium]